MDKTETSTHQRASVSLFRTAGWLQGEFDTRLRPLEMSTQQLRALNVIAAHPEDGATVGDVRDGMMDPNSNVSRLVNKLADKGLVTKTRTSEDQRVVRLRLTPAGLALRQTALKAVSGEARIWSRLSSAEAIQLTELLDRLRG